MQDEYLPETLSYLICLPVAYFTKADVNHTPTTQTADKHTSCGRIHTGKNIFYSIKQKNIGKYRKKCPKL